jgi:hypothetical protein
MNNPTTQEILGTERRQINMAETKGEKNKKNVLAKGRQFLTPLKTGRELRCSGRVSSSCSTGGTRRVNLVTNPVISREWGKDWEVFTTIVLSILLRYNDSDCPFGIFKLFLEKTEVANQHEQSYDTRNPRHRTKTNKQVHRYHRYLVHPNANENH